MGQFDKFIKKTATGAKKKELLKQDKRLAKKEQEAFYKKKKTTLATPPPPDVASPIPAHKKAAPATRGGRKDTPATATTPARQSRGKLPASKDSKEINPVENDRSGHKVAEAAIEVMPLNKYIAWSGICSRRDAALLVKQGQVKVNGKLAEEPGYKVQPGDEIKVNGKKLVPRRQMVYILLNKPKDYITTSEDDKGRKTVMDLVNHGTGERIFPVGRLDRNTTGVLLLTNDGDLAQKLTHPSFEVRKIYEVKLDKVVQKAHLEELVSGIELEDGWVAADAAGYADPKDKSVVGIEIHSGKNRVVRRMFEHLKYDVKGLDRVMFANLTKKNVDRGTWRFLVEKEVRLLKFFNKSKQKSKGQPEKIELQDAPFTGKGNRKRIPSPKAKPAKPKK